MPSLVSTIIPVYNRPQLLREAVASVLAQTYRPIEVIIVDDGSTDETGAVCDELAAAHPDVRVLHLEHVGRVGLVREAGRLAARGEFLQYLDSDDLLLPAKFATMVEALEQHPDCDIAYCYTRRYRRGELPSNVAFELTGETFNAMLPGLLARRCWHTSTPLYRKALCTRAGPWSDLLFWEDVEYDIRVGTHHPRLVHCKEFLTDFRDHDMGRVCGPWLYTDPEQINDASRAAELIYRHARSYGLAPHEPNFTLFLEDVRMLQDRCRSLGLATAARRCADVLRDAGVDHSIADDDLILRASLDPEVYVLSVPPGQEVRLPVRVTNDSSVTFRSGDFAFELSHRLLSVDGRRLEHDTPRILFAEPLRPGATRLVELPVRAPDRAGLYYLEIDVLWGAVTWLSERGNPTAIIKLLVGEATRETRWWLQVHEGSVASLVERPGQSGAAQISIATAGATAGWHIQLNRLGLSVRGGQQYTISFRARADRPRSIGVGFSKAHTPWDGLGLYQSIELEPEWRSFAEDFVATEDESNARLHFDVGGSDASVELSEVHFQPSSEEPTVEVPIYSLRARLQMDIGTRPLSTEWGADRGLAPHRYYLERFLAESAGYIRGRCLEFQDSDYVPRFGGHAVTSLDILHLDASNARATLVADLTKPNQLPSNHFDCIICTHVLQLILDVEKALADLHRILRAGGALLVGEPHVSMCGITYGEIWRFTPRGMAALLARAFGAEQVTVHGYGNSLTTAGDFRGLVTDEFTQAELNAHDTRFAVEVCAVAIKA
jgi:glycosyltransferase involved in cell wall biosynthesis/SAM-dependent methyltransferase